MIVQTQGLKLGPILLLVLMLNSVLVQLLVLMQPHIIVRTVSPRKSHALIAATMTTKSKKLLPWPKKPFKALIDGNLIAFIRKIATREQAGSRVTCGGPTVVGKNLVEFAG